MSDRIDLILAGGGLANGLIAFRLAERRPDLRLLVIEGGETLGGNHTWSFHDGDLSLAEHAWLEPFVAHRWPGYGCAFPVEAVPSRRDTPPSRPSGSARSSPNGSATG